MYNYRKNACNNYQNTELINLTPAQIILRLFQVLDKDIIFAQTAVGQGEKAKQGEKISHALAVVGELQASLDFDNGGDIAANLAGLYTYVTEELIKANINSSIEHLTNARKTIQPLMEAWLELAQTKSAPEQSQAKGGTVAGSARAITFQATF